MLGWVVTLLLVALVAALLGFGDVANVAVNAAQIIFSLVLFFFLIAVLIGIAGSGRRI